MSPDLFESLVDFHIARTGEAFTSPTLAEPESPLSDKAQRVRAFLQASSWKHSAEMHKLCSLLLGENLPAPAREERKPTALLIGALATITQDNEDYDFTIGKTYEVAEVDEDGDNYFLGNGSLILACSSCRFRPATPEEIRAYLKTKYSL